jgi:exosortase
MRSAGISSSKAIMANSETETPLSPATDGRHTGLSATNWVAIAVGGILLMAAFAWSYWPTLSDMAHVWNTVQDYSHGWLVIPLALYALWVRRDSFPAGNVHWSWYGLIVLGLCMLIRYLGALWYVYAVDGWSILLWVAGCCWLLGGWQFLKWCAPAIAFLVFMIPFPHYMETTLRQPLQRVATKFSCWMLQCMGQPAMAEGNTILLGEHHLEVEEACSGLRIFVAIAVLAFAYMMIVRPSWWERVVLFLSIVPIALISNAVRIVITGMLYQFVSTEAGKKFSHDMAGWMMIPIAAAQFMLLLWYMGKLMREVEIPSYQGGQRAAAT